MQKKLKCSVTINQIPYELELTKTLIKEFDSDLFFEDYPHLYFSPKNQNFEIFTSGVIYSSSKFIDIKSAIDIPCFTLGDNSSFLGQDLEIALYIIPQKWVIKQGCRIVQYDWSSQDLGFKSPVVDGIKHETKKEDALIAISNIKKHISDQIFSKYVYAIMKKKSVLNLPDIKSLQDFPKKGIKFFYKFSNQTFFLGITPEYLYQRQLKNIFVDAVAGTALKNNTNELQSSKIIDEFNFVKKDIQESLSAYTEEGSFYDEDTIIFAGDLAHRFNRFKACIKEDISDEILIKILHPTAAISGYPKYIACSYFKKFETFPRGYFAAPIGFYSQKKAYLAVAIRSMLIHKTQAHLFAGAGITKDSNPLLEWKELNNKLKTMKQFLLFCNQK